MKVVSRSACMQNQHEFRWLYGFYDYLTFHHQPTINRSPGTMESELFRLKSSEGLLRKQRLREPKVGPPKNE